MPRPRTQRGSPEQRPEAQTPPPAPPPPAPPAPEQRPGQPPEQEQEEYPPGSFGSTVPAEWFDMVLEGEGIPLEDQLEALFESDASDTPSLLAFLDRYAPHGGPTGGQASAPRTAAPPPPQRPARPNR